MESEAVTTLLDAAKDLANQATYAEAKREELTESVERLTRGALYAAMAETLIANSDKAKE